MKTTIAHLCFLLLAASAQAQWQGTWTTNAGTITITSYTGNASAVTIPATINNLPVTSIGNSAFSQKVTLTSISFPNSLTSIQDHAFFYCYNLTSITIPNSVTTIGYGAFQWCEGVTSINLGTGVTSIGDAAFNQTAITSIVIPNSVTNIGSSAFCACEHLTTVTIPATVIYIGIQPFSGNALTAINVNSGNPNYSSVSGVLFDKAKTTLITYPQGSGGSSYTIPKGVTTIAPFSFVGSFLTTITFPMTVANLGANAFWDCNNLTGAYFQGNALNPANDTSVFSQDFKGIIYYDTYSTGWGSTFDGLPTALCGSCIPAEEITWNNPAPITYGTALNSGQLNATATVSGSFAYNPPAGTVLTVGNHIISATFTPSDISDYVILTNIVNVTVNKGMPTITVAPTANIINYGQTLSNSLLNGGSSSVTGSFTFTMPSTVPNAGTALQSVTFTPTDTTNYNQVTFNVSVTVNKGTPTITVSPTASVITYGQVLSNSVLSGGVGSVPGNFTFTVSSTIPNAGTTLQNVTFTPADTNYNAITVNVNVPVNKGMPAVTTIPAASAITYGQIVSNSVLSGGIGSVPGNFAFTVPSTIPNVGTTLQNVTFTPADTNYNVVTINVNVMVVYGTLIINGDFETGDFSSWAQFGNTKDNSINANATNYVHSGTYGAKMGPSGTPSYLTQAVPTKLGVAYLLSLWLNSEGAVPNEFSVSWNGIALFDQKNMGTTGWTNLQFQVTAMTTNSVLQLGFRNDPSYFGLDNITLIQIASPSPNIFGINIVGTNLVITGLNGVNGGSYVILMSTNLISWNPVATNALGVDGYFTLTATNIVNRKIFNGFYKLQKQ